MNERRAAFPFVMGGLAFACFLLVLVFMAKTVQPLWGRTLLLLLPALLLFGVGVLARKGIPGPEKTAVVTAILSVVLLVLSVCYVFLLSIWTATTTTTDTSYYARAYRLIDDRACVGECFPAAVPEDAADVLFSYCPQFLQGGEEFRLSYRTTEEKLAEWSGRLAAAAEWVGPDEEWLRLHQQLPGDPGPVRYQLYGEGFSNHGEECFVRIDPDGSRIEFNYSRW